MRDFADDRAVRMLMEAAAGPMRGDICLQARGGFEPVVEIMAGNAVVLLLEVIGVIANFVVAGLTTIRDAVGFMSHRCCRFG